MRGAHSVPKLLTWLNALGAETRRTSGFQARWFRVAGEELSKGRLPARRPGAGDCTGDGRQGQFSEAPQATGSTSTPFDHQVAPAARARRPGRRPAAQQLAHLIRTAAA